MALLPNSIIAKYMNSLSHAIEDQLFQPLLLSSVLSLNPRFPKWEPHPQQVSLFKGEAMTECKALEEGTKLTAGMVVVVYDKQTRNNYCATVREIGRSEIPYRLVWKDHREMAVSRWFRKDYTSTGGCSRYVITSIGEMKTKMETEKLKELVSSMKGDDQYSIVLPHRDMVDIIAISDGLSPERPVAVVHVARETREGKVTSSENLECFVLIHWIIYEKSQLIGMNPPEPLDINIAGSDARVATCSAKDIGKWTAWAKKVRNAQWKFEGEKIREHIKVNVHLIAM